MASIVLSFVALCLCVSCKCVGVRLPVFVEGVHLFTCQSVLEESQLFRARDDERWRERSIESIGCMHMKRVSQAREHTRQRLSLGFLLYLVFRVTCECMIR